MLKQKKIFDIRLGQHNNVDLRVFEKKSATGHVLFSRGKKAEVFFTEDSKLYITPRQQELERKGIAFDRSINKWDSLSSRVVTSFVRYAPMERSGLAEKLERRYELLGNSVTDASEKFMSQFTLVRLWNMSIVGSILLGMVMMTFVYRYLGQGAAADQLQQSSPIEQSSQRNLQGGKVLGIESAENDPGFAQQVQDIIKISDKQAFEKEIRDMVKGYPIEKMVPYIAEQDRIVAAFIVAIAKKESGWGQHVPVLNGQDCYNYWGYRGIRQLMGTGGHTCFNSSKDAVETVAKRIKTLVEKEGNSTPADMVLWKCGTDCQNDAGAKKWISDVAGVFDQLDN